MTAVLLFDCVLALLIAGVAWFAISARGLFTAIMFFVVYGILTAVAWLRLDGIDVALAEAAIGAGLTGVLLVGAMSGLERARESEGPGWLARGFSGVISAAAAALLMTAVLHLDPQSPGLVHLLSANLDSAGAGNPATAVLLNFRAYDTLLESMVLLAALNAIWSLAPDAFWGGRPGLRQHVRPDGVLVAVLLESAARGEVYEARLQLAPGLELLLRTDTLALLFVSLSAFLWLLTTIYAISYFGTQPDLSRFFGFFSLCVAATTGIALAGTLITFFVFYEMLTLSTWPLVVHRADATSLAAGRKYLVYTLTGSAALLVGIVWLESLTGPIEFAVPAGLEKLEPSTLSAVFVLLVGGLAVKTAMVPLHAWLPAAMVAPAPVSALLHAVAVVKAGAFGIVRVIYDVYGTALVANLGVGLPLAVMASVTIIYGSLGALAQTDIKRRLAY